MIKRIQFTQPKRNKHPIELDPASKKKTPCQTHAITSFEPVADDYYLTEPRSALWSSFCYSERRRLLAA